MRFTDHSPAELGLLDFRPRDRSRQGLYIVLAFLCVILAVLMLSGEATGVVVVLLVALCLMTLYFRQRSNDLVLATEFQNMIYAGAAASGSLFILVVQRDGMVIHASPGLSGLFDRFPYPMPEMLRGFFAEGKVSSTDQEKLYQALQHNTAKTIVIRSRTKAGDMGIVITVEPLSRPAGYYALRARAFQESRDGKPTLFADEAEAYRGLLEASPTPHFVADPYGKITYANRAFSELFGKTGDDILTRKPLLDELMQRTDGSVIGSEDGLAAHEATPVTLRGTLLHGGAVPLRLNLRACQTLSHSHLWLGTLTKDTAPCLITP